MTDVADERLATDGFAAAPTDRSEGAVAQSGAALFPDLVWAHFCWERRRKGTVDAQCEALERTYAEKLAEFESKVGQLEEVYWSTRAASAVAMTVRRDGDDRYTQPNGAGKTATALHRGQAKGRSWIRSLRLGEPDQVARLHRVSDWVTRDTNDVADLLQQCDLLAIKVREVLRGTTELIALRWIFGVEAHVLGFMERGPRKPDEAATRKLIRSQRRELAEIEDFYHRAASKAGRLVYVTGMLIGILVALALGTLVGLLLWISDLWNGNSLIILCYAAGALGALVSALSRMGKPETGQFNIDFELGRPLLRRLGFFRPFVGALFGVALYFLFSSGILQIKFDEGSKTFYYGFAAFLAGFSERYTTVVFGAAERKLAPTAGTSGDSSLSGENGEPDEQVAKSLDRIESGLADLEARLK